MDAPQNIRTVFFADGGEITVAHEPCSDIGTPPADVVVASEEDVTPDTLTRVEVTGSERFVVLVHWCPTSVASFGVLLVPETMTLFIGAGTLVVVVNLPNRKLASRHTVCLFWSFMRRKQFVVELGELDCYLYDLHGAQLGDVQVDPPYELTEHPEGIQFDSPVYGVRWLKYPGPAAAV